MGRRRACTSLLAAMLLVAAPASASAAERVLSKTGSSPALAGDSVVWEEAGGYGPQRPNGTRTLWAAAPGEEPRQVFAPPDNGRDTWFEDVAATEGLAAVVVGGAQGLPGAVWAGDPRGAITRLDDDDYFARGCWQTAVDVDGRNVAHAEVNCESSSAIVVRDLTGLRPPTRVPAQPVPNGSSQKTRLRLAGNFLAYNEFGLFQPGRPHWLVLRDWVRGEEVVRIDVSKLVPGDPSYSAGVLFDLTADGTVVFVAHRPGADSARYTGWLSAADPTPHRIPVDASVAAPALSPGGLVALRRESSDDLAVIDLTGRAVDVFERERIHSGQVAFNGRRLAWRGIERLGDHPGAPWLPGLLTSEFPRAPASVPDVVDGLGISPKRFAVPVGAAASRRRRGARVSYTLKRPARSRILIERASRGRKARRRCRRASKRVPQRRRCTRWVRVGSVDGTAAIGKVTQPFSGRVGRRALRPGRYRAAILPTLGRGTRGRAARTGFTIVKR